MTNTINYTQTRNIEALPVGTSTPEEVAAFLEPTLYTFHYVTNEGPNFAGTLYKKGEGIGVWDWVFHPNEYFVKVDGNFYPESVGPQDMERLFGIVL